MTMLLPHRCFASASRGPSPAPQGQGEAAGCRGSALPRWRVTAATEGTDGAAPQVLLSQQDTWSGDGPRGSSVFHGPVLPLCVSVSGMEMSQLCPEPRLAQGRVYRGKPPCSSSATAAQKQPAQSCVSPPRSVLLSLLGCRQPQQPAACPGSGVHRVPRSEAERDPNPTAHRGADPT